MWFYNVSGNVSVNLLFLQQASFYNHYFFTPENLRGIIVKPSDAEKNSLGGFQY